MTFDALRMSTKCFSGPVPDSRVIGGQDADVGEYPFMAELFYFNLKMCAGTLISEDYVLTAAQCLDGVSM